MSEHLAVGLMSGTSLDGVSTALVRLDDAATTARLVAFRQEPYSAPERGAIIEAIARGGAKELALLHVALAERFAGAALQLGPDGSVLAATSASSDCATTYVGGEP